MARREEKKRVSEASVEGLSNFRSVGVEHLFMECLAGSRDVLVYGYGETCGGIKAAV